jgi:hypothetical protein
MSLASLCHRLRRTRAVTLSALTMTMPKRPPMMRTGLPVINPKYATPLLLQLLTC